VEAFFRNHLFTCHAALARKRWQDAKPSTFGTTWMRFIATTCLPAALA